MILLRYHWRFEQSGRVGDKLAGFTSLARAFEQVRAWRARPWDYWIEPQAGIALPKALMKQGLVFTQQPITQQIIATPDLFYPEDNRGRWRTLFERVGCAFDEALLAPAIEPGKQPDADGPTL